MFLFLLRYEFASLRSFIVCFIRKADLSLTYPCEGQVYYEMNAFIHPRVPVFLLAHACCWAAKAATGIEGRLLTLMSPAERVLWLKKQSWFSIWIWKPQQFQWQKSLIFLINPNSMVNLHVKISFHSVLNNGLMPFLNYWFNLNLKKNVLMHIP